MERAAQHVVPVTPPGILDAQQTNTSTAAVLQSSLNASVPQTGLISRESSSGIASKVSGCSDEQHYPASAGWDHSATSRLTSSPGKSGLPYPGQVTQSPSRDGMGSWDKKAYEQFGFYPFAPEALSFSDDGAVSNRTPLVSPTYLSPVISSRLTPQSRQDQLRFQSRDRASPSPCPSMRLALDSRDGFHHMDGWPIDSHSVTIVGQPSPFRYGLMPESTMPTHLYSIEAPVSSIAQGTPHNSPSAPGNTIPMQPFYATTMPIGGYKNSTTMMHSHRGPSIYSPDHMHHDNSHHSLPQPLPLAPHNLRNLLQQSIEFRSVHRHYTGSAPLDLNPTVYEAPAPPPPEDMHPSDADLVPYQQEFRFDGDMYTPKWVRGHGSKREGWCGTCTPGRWLLLKNSAYWYDKSFTHGISAATGAPFPKPLEMRRMGGNQDVWKGLCGSCNQWIALVSSKKKATTWFRHAYKCHSYAKMKDAPKRRREHAYHQRLSGPSLSSVSLGSMHAQHQQQRLGTPPPLLPHGCPATSWVVTGLRW